MSNKTHIGRFAAFGNYGLIRIYFIALSLLPVTDIFAQQIDSSRTEVRPQPVGNSKSQLFWTTIGWGGSSIDDEFPIGFGLIENRQYGKSTLSARLIYTTGTQANKLPHEKALDVGLLYGIAGQHELWHAQAAIGLAYVYRTKRIIDHQDPGPLFPIDVYRSESFQTIGLAFQLQCFSQFSDSSHAGFGFTICGDINKPRSFGLFLFSFVLGTF